MAMPFNMILILYEIPCKLSSDLSKLAILYMYVYMYIYSIIVMTNMSVMTFLNVNKMSIYLSVNKSPLESLFLLVLTRGF